MGLDALKLRFDSLQFCERLFAMQVQARRFFEVRGQKRCAADCKNGFHISNR